MGGARGFMNPAPALAQVRREFPLTPAEQDEQARQAAIAKYGPDVVQYSAGASRFAGRDGSLPNYTAATYAPKYTGPSIAAQGLPSNFTMVYEPDKGWYPFDATPGASGGYLKNSTVGGLLSAPVRSLGSQLTNLAHGENVGKTLADDLAISQGAITKGIDSAFGRAGEAVAGYGRKLTAAEGANLRQQGAGAEAISQGDVSRGLNTMEEAGRTFGRNPNVAIPASMLAAYFGQAWLAPYLSAGAAAAGAGAASGTIGAAGAGAAIGAGTSAAMGDSNLTTGALSGALGGATGAIGRGIGGTTGAVTGGALGGAGGAAIRGGDRNQILQGGLMGGAAGLASGIGGQYGGRLGATAASNLTRQFMNRQFSQPTQQRPVMQQRPMLSQGNPQANPALSRYNSQQLQQLYAQYQAQRRG